MSGEIRKYGFIEAPDVYINVKHLFLPFINKSSFSLDYIDMN